MEKPVPVNRETIRGICEEHGFGFREEAGRCVALIGEKDVVVMFDGEGRLPRGRHQFMTAAREACPEFAARYPARSRAAGKPRSGKAGTKAKELPVLDSRLLTKYPLGQLEKLAADLPAILATMREAEARRQEREKVAADLARLKKVIGEVKELGYSPPSEMQRELEARQARLHQLLATERASRTEPESGMPS